MHEEAKALQLERYKAEHWRWNVFVVRPFFVIIFMQPTLLISEIMLRRFGCKCGPLSWKQFSKEIDARLQIVKMNKI
jgi:hypothetical protein